MGDRRDRPDDAEWRVLDYRQTPIAAEHFAPHELDARRPLTKRLQLLDFVLQPANLCLMHLHRAQFDALFDGNPTDMIDDSLAVLNRSLLKLIERIACRRYRFIRAGENAVATAERF